MKDGAYVMNPDEYKSVAAHWIALHVNGNNVIYFDSFALIKEIIVILLKK